MGYFVFIIGTQYCLTGGAMILILMKEFYERFVFYGFFFFLTKLNHGRRGRRVESSDIDHIKTVTSLVGFH